MNKTRMAYIPVDSGSLEGILAIPKGANGIVVFAHGSGSSSHSPRNQQVAQALERVGLATLLFDLLTPKEAELDQFTGEYRFNIPLLAQRLLAASDWLRENQEIRHLKIGYFGASTGAAAALVVASQRPELVGAVVSRGGRPDLALEVLSKVGAPTLLIVGGLDSTVLALNHKALRALGPKGHLEIVEGATHLFEEPGALDQVAELAGRWFLHHLVLAEAGG
ncbi:MAG: dienelactone hydrolase family protein [Deinococcus sp.]|nr:dienelactone hydrolase family protein [Deinococcus sp.]